MVNEPTEKSHSPWANSANSCNPELHDGSQSAGKFPRSAKINWQLATGTPTTNFPKATLDHERLPSGNFNIVQPLNIAIDS